MGLLQDLEIVQRVIENGAAVRRSELRALDSALEEGAKYLMYNEHVALQRRRNALREEMDEIEDQIVAIRNQRSRAIGGVLPNGLFVPVEPEPESTEPLPPVNRQRKVRIRK